MHVEVREPPVGFGFGFLLLPYGSGEQFWGTDSGPQAWQQGSLPTGSSHGPGKLFKKINKND